MSAEADYTWVAPDDIACPVCDTSIDAEDLVLSIAPGITEHRFPCPECGAYLAVTTLVRFTAAEVSGG